MRSAPLAFVPVLVLAAALASPLPAAGQPQDEPPAELLEIPRPSLEIFEEADRRQLEVARASLDELLAADGVPRENLASAFGGMGSLYLLYDLLDSAEPALRNASALAPAEHAWHYYLAVLYEREGRTEESRERLERAAELRPDDLPTLLRLGRAELDAGRLNDAGKHFRAALEIDPESAAAVVGLGQIAYEEGRVDEAIDLYRRGLELQPRANSIHHRLGLAYRRAGDLEKAKEELALNQAEPVRFQDPLVDGLSNMLRGSSIYFARGNHAMMEGDHDRAVEEYRRAAERDPDEPTIHFNLGLALLRSGRRAEALSHLERAVAFDPEYRDAHYNLATALAEDGRWVEAAEHFERAWRIDPLDHAAHLDWASALAQAGERESAVRELTDLIGTLSGEASPVAGHAHLRLALLLDDTAPDAALDHYGKAVEQLPDSGEARTALAAALGRAGRLDAAAAEYGAAARIDPSDPAPRFGQAMALLLGGRHGDARRTLESALAEGATGDEALPLVHLLARILATAPEPAVRDGARALALAGEVFERAPGLEHAETLAMAYAEAGQPDRAAEWQRRVLARAEAQGRPSALLDLIRARLALYERGEVVRSPWSGPRAAPESDG